MQDLKKLYFDGTKHAVYQNIPLFVQEELGYTVEIDESWRGDSARYRNLLQNLAFENNSVVGDIGANTGFFTLSLAHRFSGSIFHAYEANPNHYHFMMFIKKQFKLSNVLINNLCVDIDGLDRLPQHDYLLNFNVLHHAGIDFDKGIKDVDAFEQYAKKYLKKMNLKTKYMVFQMGFNWGGDKTKPIIQLDDDAGKVLYMSNIFRESEWKIDRIFTVRKARELEYYKVNKEIINALNNDLKNAESQIKQYYSHCDMSSFSEFYRRPLFYLISQNNSQEK